VDILNFSTPRQCILKWINIVIRTVIAVAMSAAKLVGAEMARRLNVERGTAGAHVTRRENIGCGLLIAWPT
jgi:hypothetical protein